MLNSALVLSGDLVLPHGILPNGALLVREGRIDAIGRLDEILPGLPLDTPYIVAEGFIAPGFVDLHVHGGAGADFMDGDEAAFAAVLKAHARHGTTSLLPTSTAARHEQIVAMLETCRQFRHLKTPTGARVLGAHFYGPYFCAEARGCHPAAPIRAPAQREYEQYLEFADSIATASVAPELDGAEPFARACTRRGVRVNAGHSHATFARMQESIGWGVRHVDHLYCAMSDKSKLRRRQSYPMQGGVLEATLYFEELSTEVIADGKHLSPDLLLLALKIKGPDLLALVTDCNRALELRDGPYIFGPREDGEPFIRHDGVGKTPDGQALASSVCGMDHMVRTFAAQTGRPLWEVVRMASLTPARIAGWDRDLGSLDVGKFADFLLLNRDLEVEQVFIGGAEFNG